MIDQQTVYRRLVITEVISFVIGGLALLAYWIDPGYLTVGLLFSLEYLIAIANTYLWFKRTSGSDSQPPDTRPPERNLST